MKKGTKEKDSVDPFAAALYSAPHRSQVSLLVGCPNDTRAIKKLCGPAAAYLWPDDGNSHLRGPHQPRRPYPSSPSPIVLSIHLLTLFLIACSDLTCGSTDDKLNMEATKAAAD